MARRYDSRTTIFSPEGRLYQVEYAMEAISHAGTVIGVLSKDGIVLAAERQATSNLLEQSIDNEKIYEMNDNVVAGVAGHAADANILINQSRAIAQRYLLKYDSPMPVEQLVRRLCDMKQGYTQYGGLRPFGVSFLCAGWDSTFGFQLYQSDPAGNYSSWKAACIGENYSNAQSILKQEYKDEEKDEPSSGTVGAQMTMDDALKLTCQVLSKTIDTAKLSSKKLEFATITLKAGKPFIHVYSSTEIDEVLKKYESVIKPADSQ
ncbi:Proteasome subunit alpha type-3 [Coemansia sp. RSA 376]|nr:Proteasome subunit alpha type-3 [Coemansia sp. S17]KAJ2040805.1 Proteasome subunit alpha type-3 [Coemansia sp. S3946]KAJ2054574.1 Proteasome subunit alpha type-3 [Coemansia sp. S2]KAJ2059691.1 Proteasome subunit alpha type-3 [Coemansia sp. S155-1]KAJ2098005.1 Proteasome subunit alpha type-3 [Coemansia sp. S100]KAJ2105330.1 Proteasome subunit alpha type-3 [Coemansia sp. RSA 922]KAJ2260712.1 Proteasome subunit alpha type-3 [Coemansia sp. RSA 376]KAJ2347608.1 Proteasome subunit alpha type-3 